MTRSHWLLRQVVSKANVATESTIVVLKCENEEYAQGTFMDIVSVEALHNEKSLVSKWLLTHAGECGLTQKTLAGQEVICAEGVHAAVIYYMIATGKISDLKLFVSLNMPYLMDSKLQRRGAQACKTVHLVSDLDFVLAKSAFDPYLRPATLSVEPTCVSCKLSTRADILSSYFRHENNVLSPLPPERPLFIEQDVFERKRVYYFLDVLVVLIFLLFVVVLSFIIPIPT